MSLRNQNAISEHIHVQISLSGKHLEQTDSTSNAWADFSLQFDS